MKTIDLGKLTEEQRKRLYEKHCPWEYGYWKYQHRSGGVKVCEKCWEEAIEKGERKC